MVGTPTGVVLRYVGYCTITSAAEFELPVLDGIKIHVVPLRLFFSLLFTPITINRNNNYFPNSNSKGVQLI